MPETPLYTVRLNRADLRTIRWLIDRVRLEIRNRPYELKPHLQAEEIATLGDLNMLGERLAPEFKAAGICDPDDPPASYDYDELGNPKRNGVNP